MYCSTCGVAVAGGLNYCNYCGTKIASRTDSESQELKPGLVVSAMAGIFVLGLPGIAFLSFLLSEGVHLDPPKVMAFAGVAFLIMIMLETVFITLLFRRKHGPGETREPKQLQQPVTNSLRDSTERTLPEHIPSVTEHTTRAFDRMTIDQPEKSIR